MLSLTASTYVYSAGDAAAGKEKAVACGACHGADGNSEVGSFPKLAGQNTKYLINQLTAIQSGEREVPEMVGQLDGKNEQDLEEYHWLREKIAANIDDGIENVAKQIIKALSK